MKHVYPDDPAGREETWRGIHYVEPVLPKSIQDSLRSIQTRVRYGHMPNGWNWWPGALSHCEGGGLHPLEGRSTSAGSFWFCPICDFSLMEQALPELYRERVLLDRWAMETLAQGINESFPG